MNAERNSPGASPPLISQYTGKGLLYAFVYRTAQRRILAELRRRGRAAVSIDATQLPLTTTETEHESWREVRRALAEILGQLSDRERIVLRMTCDGCSNSEIARRITPPSQSPVHDGRVSHIRNGIVTRIRKGLGSLVESLPGASTIISDLLIEFPASDEVSA